MSISQLRVRCELFVTADARQISGADAYTSYRRPVREGTGAGRMSACAQVCAPPPRRKAA
jgi:hypothetical protein